jgi:hypothetical protein
MLDGGPHEPVLAWRPLTAVWDVTRACDRGCLHSPSARDLGQREALALIPQLVELGPRLLVLSGDDPLQRPGLDEIIAAAVAAGLRVGLDLVPTALLTARRLQRFAELGVERVALGLDGPDALTHDRERGAGSFSATRAAIAAAKDARLRVELTRGSRRAPSRISRARRRSWRTSRRRSGTSTWSCRRAGGATRPRWGRMRASACSDSSANGIASEACR